MGVVIGKIDCPLCSAVGMTTDADICESVGGRRTHIYWRCPVCGTASPMLPGGQRAIRKAAREMCSQPTPQPTPQPAPAPAPTPAPVATPPAKSPEPKTAGRRVPILGGLLYRTVKDEEKP